VPYPRNLVKRKVGLRIRIFPSLFSASLGLDPRFQLDARLKAEHSNSRSGIPASAGTANKGCCVSAEDLMRLFPVLGGAGIDPDRHVEDEGGLGGFFHHGLGYRHGSVNLGIDHFKHKLIMHL
jgi:hypothetical protein